MTENWLKLALIALQAVVVVVCGVLIAIGKDSAITDVFIAVSGSAGILGLWERIKNKPAE